MWEWEQDAEADFLFFFGVSESNVNGSNKLEMATILFFEIHEDQEDGFYHFDAKFFT